MADNESEKSPHPPQALPRPCPAALGAFGVPARRWSTRADLYRQLEKGRLFLESRGCSATLSEAADAAGLSEFHFARLFRETYQESPAVFHRRALMIRAKQLLREMAVAEVAEELEYRSVSSFVRSFRKATGVTPGASKRLRGQATGRENL